MSPELEGCPYLRWSWTEKLVQNFFWNSFRYSKHAQEPGRLMDPSGHPFLLHFPYNPSCAFCDHVPDKHLHLNPCLRVCFWGNPNKEIKGLCEDETKWNVLRPWTGSSADPHTICFLLLHFLTFNCSEKFPSFSPFQLSWPVSLF